MNDLIYLIQFQVVKTTRGLCRADVEGTKPGQRSKGSLERQSPGEQRSIPRVFTGRQQEWSAPGQTQGRETAVSGRTQDFALQWET